MTHTEKLVDFVRRTDYEKLPPEVVRQAKSVILDTLGCGLATIAEDPPKAEIAFNFVRRFAKPEEATVLGQGLQASSLMAAFANGILCHGIDFDDTHKEALTHTSAVIVPAALASAESSGLGGKELVTSTVLGYEVAVRVGMAVMPSHYKFWHSTATNGTFGAAMAAGKNFGLDKERLTDALGLAGTQAAGLLTYLEFGDYTKSFNPGKSAFNGIFAALLAEAGASGPPTMLEHPRGYSYAYSAEPKLDNLTRGLGSTYEIMLNAFKPYPSLLASHPPIDAILSLRKAHRLTPERIRKITSRTYNTVKSHFSNYNPETTMAARLSVPYCMAVAAADGAAGLEQFTLEKINDPRVREMLGRIEIIADAELNKLYPEKFPAVVSIETTDGQVYQEAVYYPTGDPNNPLSVEALKDKFRGLAGRFLAPAAVEGLIEMVDNLEQVDDVRALTRLTTKG